MPYITNAVEKVTPAIAREWLETNHNNRNITRTAVNRYRNDMESGRWRFTGEAIQFDESGQLINGQHRLTALANIEDEDFSIDFLVIRGLPRDAQMVMDQGRGRGTGQQLQMTGVKDANTVAAGVRMYLGVKSGWLFRNSSDMTENITTAVIEEWVADNRGMVDALAQFTGSIKNPYAPSAVTYCAAMLFWQKNPQACIDFFHGLKHGAGDATHPITVLDKRLQRNRIEGLKISNRDLLGIFIQSWNAWRTGRTVARFQRPRSGHWTIETFPRVAS